MSTWSGVPVSTVGPERSRILRGRGPPGGLTSLTVILLLFSLWHASYALGVRLTLAFFAITAVTSWIFEEVGVATGLVFGPYHYTATWIRGSARSPFSSPSPGS